MLKTASNIAVALVFFLFFFSPFFIKQVLAVENCSIYQINIDPASTLGQTYNYQQKPITIRAKLSGQGITPGQTYSLGNGLITSPRQQAQEQLVDISWTDNYLANAAGDYTVYLHNTTLPGNSCILGSYTVRSEHADWKCEKLLVYQIRGGASCYGGPGGCISNENPPDIIIKAKVLSGTNPYTGNIEIMLKDDNENAQHLGGGVHQATFRGSHEIGPETIKVRNRSGSNEVICSGSFTISGSCSGTCKTDEINIAVNNQNLDSSNEPYKICDQIDRQQDYLQEAYNRCIACIGGETGSAGIWTAIGCIPRDPTMIVQNLLRVGLGMGGGVALLMCLGAGFLFSTSQGDPKRTGEAKELLTAAITGLLFIIFSVVILQFIGYSVLKIPGFGG